MSLQTLFTPLGMKHLQPTVVGIYGLPGSGKSYILSQLKQALGQEHFAFYESSEVIASLCPGGLDFFKKSSERDKQYWREKAINKIGNDCVVSRKAGITTGHFMFWSEGEESVPPAWTRADQENYSHILYFDIPADVIIEQRNKDPERNRAYESAEHVQKWQQTEKDQLRKICRDNGILFSLVLPKDGLLDSVLKLLRDFQKHTEGYNLFQAKSKVDEAVALSGGKLTTMLVLDGDRTLIARDTGHMFWQMIAKGQQPNQSSWPVREVFSSSMGYSYTAFRQASLLYEEMANDDDYEQLCDDLAARLMMYADFTALLHMVLQQDYVGAVIVTCGLRRVWEKLVEREHLSDKIQVIGGGRIAEGYVVTGAVKASLVAHLQNVHAMHVWAFGDSKLDLDMLCTANKAVVVVGEEHDRSKDMDGALRDAIKSKSLVGASQVLLPNSATPRLDNATLPLLDLTAHTFVNAVLSPSPKLAGYRLTVGTNRTTVNLLATPARSTETPSLSLGEAHRRIGWYMAVEHLTLLLDLTSYKIPHVLDRPTDGFRLFHEQDTTIAALMRGGEPMAYGVADAFPLAMFMHAKEPHDIKIHHLKDQVTIILVDSVINTGETVIRFVEHVRGLHATIRIVVVAYVAPEATVEKGGVLDERFKHQLGAIWVVLLRTSKTSFKGTGKTDTGNRLFGTTHLR